MTAAGEGTYDDTSSWTAYRATVVIYSTDADGRSSIGSGFIVQLNGRYWIASAAHVVRPSVESQHSIQVDLTIGSDDSPTLERYPIDFNMWMISSHHDIAVALLPEGGRLVVRGLRALDGTLLAKGFRWRGPLSTQYFGVVAVGGDRVILGRTGALATPDQPKVNLAGVDDPVSVALVEGSVTPGMSGGPVIVHTGSAGHVLGVIHGYATPKIARRSRRGEPPALANLRDDLHDVETEVVARRHHLVYVVPSGALSAALAVGERELASSGRSQSVRRALAAPPRRRAISLANTTDDLRE